jgi:predicted CopG family antitoxin
MVKVISLSNEAYNKLRLLKRDKSFSEIVIELVDKKPSQNIMKLAGAWSDNAKKWAAIEIKLYSDRRKFKLHH